MDLGMVGLGRMGAGLAERLREAGHTVVGYDVDPDVSEVGSLAELVDRLDGERRVIWMMVPAGGPTDATVDELAGLLEEGDLVVDGGNTNYEDTLEHAEVLAEAGVALVDVGVSGGPGGRDAGFALMVGGDAADVGELGPVLEALAPPSGGLAHVGEVGAGHFTKMVHNAVEYAMMQALGEGYELLAASDLDVDPVAALRSWQQGSVVRSWLLDLLVGALEDDPGLEDVAGWVDDSGHGRWAVQEAIDLGVAVPGMATALFARFASRQQDAPALRAVATLRREFGGHAVQEVE
jgi:6-phosphogluconate dehydrogenase